ncbi:coiled-coil domain-containing protein 13-like [Babylonia areolata]|uniref:coiled-coil domain-containing protein 13-like n=1 Tax=Babylonia areolata TaxID=304850 RepID=UPI003FD0581E
MEGGGESLKQQFQLLQEQQQKRLQLRLQRKEEKDQQNKAHTARSSATTTTTTTASATSLTSRAGSEFGVTDNLDLKLTDPAPLGPSYLSEELVEHLNTQIREMKDENGRLYKLLSEKDFEIKQLKKKKNDEKTAVMESQLTNETAATKIVELSKKIRELRAELESERTRSKQLMRKCTELETQMSSSRPPDTQSLNSANFGSVISLRSVTVEPKEADEVDVKALQDKLKTTESKMADFRNQCQMLKQEVKVAQKVLSQELGENVNIQALLNNAGNFRGRAQQIIALQNKVEELKTQLAATQPPLLESETLGTKTSARRQTQDDKYRQELRRLEKERKETQEREAQERKALEEDHQSLKQRMEAAKARNKVLAGEVKSLKQQMQTLLQKGNNDDELISALMKQQTQLKQMLEETTNQKSDALRRQEEAAKQLSQKSQQDSNLVSQLRAIVADREAKVKAMEEQLEQMRNAQDQQQQQQQQQQQFFLNTEGRPSPDSQCQTPVVTIPMSGLSSRQSTHDSLTGPSVTPPQSRQSQRPGSVQREVSAGMTRAPTFTLPPPGSAQGDRTTVGELQYQCQEYHTLLQATNVERDRLSELVQVMQTRVNAETQKVSDLQTELMAVRRQNVELEKQLGRQGLDKGGVKKKGTSRATSNTAGRDALVEEEESAEGASGGSDVQELMTTMEIQKDEIDALKAALQRTLKAKEDDLNLYSQTIDETKQVFLQALRQLKQSKMMS